MTLVEFIAPLKSETHQARVLAVLYYKERYEGTRGLTADQVKAALKTARAPGAAKVNVSDVLNKSGQFVDTTGVAGKARLWALTDTGHIEVRRLLKLPEPDAEIEHDVGTLEAVVAKIKNEDARDYLAEAVKCLQVGALRATVVFAWSATIRTIHERLLDHGPATVSSALGRHDPKGRAVSRIDDFAHVKDSIALLAAKDLGLIDKNEKDTLEEALDLRNRCGHPGKYKPGAKKVSGFIEDIVSIVFK